jgi:hypothetical protein
VRASQGILGAFLDTVRALMEIVRAFLEIFAGLERGERHREMCALLINCAPVPENCTSDPANYARSWKM